MLGCQRSHHQKYTTLYAAPRSIEYKPKLMNQNSALARNEHTSYFCYGRSDLKAK